MEVPSHFLCPISLQLMRDPVTVSTGITYDRESIEKWLFSCNNNTCPITKQLVFDSTDLIPNHTLRRLIQAWCTLNSSEQIPTPKPHVDKAQIVELLNDAKKFPQRQLKCLLRLKSIVSQSERNRKCVEGVGAVEFLVSTIKEHKDDKEAEEALSIIHCLDISETNIKNLITQNVELVDALVDVLKRLNNFQSRASATMLLRSICKVADPIQLISIQLELFVGIVQVLRDNISNQASKAALKLLVELCPWGRNRVKAVEAGVVSVLTDLLLNTSEKRRCELALTVLDRVCSCAEGRAELLKHAAGVAIVSKKILRVSHVASDKAVRILSLISRFSATPKVLQEMLQVGVVSKLCLLLEMDCNYKTKERSREILKLHSRVWKNSSCVPPHLLSSYPSS